MKRQYIVPVLGLCAMALSTACSDDDLRDNDFTHPGKNTIVFNCQSQLDENNPVVWDKDSQLGFFCSQIGNVNTTIGVAAVSVGHQDGLFYTQQEWGEGEHTFYLYSPHNPANTLVTSISGTVSDTQNQTGDTKGHLMGSALVYAKTKSSKVDTPIEMNLKHALAYLDFNCKTSATYVGWSVKSIQLSNESDKKITGTYSLNMDTEALTLSAGEPKLQLKVSEAPAFVANESFHGYAAVAPVNLSSTDCDVVIMLQKDGLDYEYKLTSTLKPGDIKAGAFQVLNLALDGMPVEKIGDTSVNLSETETANCYIAGIAGQEYRFKATVMGNGKETPAAEKSVAIIPSELNPQSAQLLWQTSPGLISGVNMKNGFIYFTLNGSETTPLIQGNAVIAAYSGAGGTGDILWSWHIWVTNEDLDAKVQTYKIQAQYEQFEAFRAPVMMDRNLGATSAELWSSATAEKEAHGLFYQWGRKDPFIGPSSTNSFATVYDKDGKSIAAAECPKIVKTAVARADMHKHPMEFYATGVSWLNETDDNLNLWGNTTLWTSVAPIGDSGTKSIYDPCPPGYRVPHPAVWTNFNNAANGNQAKVADFPLNLIQGTSANLGATGTAGLKFDCDGNGTAAIYPGIGFIDFKTGALQRVAPGANGRCDYWANAGMSATNGTRFFTDGLNNCGTSMTGGRAYGFGVRCMRDEIK